MNITFRDISPAEAESFGWDTPLVIPEDSITTLTVNGEKVAVPGPCVVAGFELLAEGEVVVRLLRLP